MKTLQTLAIFISFGLLSCNNNRSETIVERGNVTVDTSTTDSGPKSIKQTTPVLSDYIKKIKVDDYPITNPMLADKTSNNSSYKKQSGQTYSFDKVWFSNDTINQTLVFELYTDYHRLVTYHFLNNDIPFDLITRIELHIGGGEFASDKQKLKDFSGFLKQTTKINTSYFITEKGFRLGDTKQKAVEVYGNPDKQIITEGIEILEWLFIGDNSYDGKTDLKGKPLADKSYGHQILMYFRNGKLIGQILRNDMP